VDRERSRAAGRWTGLHLTHGRRGRKCNRDLRRQSKVNPVVSIDGRQAAFPCAWRVVLLLSLMAIELAHTHTQISLRGSGRKGLPAGPEEQKYNQACCCCVAHAVLSTVPEPFGSDGRLGGGSHCLPPCCPPFVLVVVQRMPCECRVSFRIRRSIDHPPCHPSV
jgi:hypothetical protein